MNRNSIIAEAIIRITNSLLAEQDDEQFCILLEKYGLIDLLPTTLPYFHETQKNGKIILFGGSSVKINELQGCLKSLNIDKKRFEYIPYDEVTNYNFKNLEYNNNYRLILLGPVPHSAKGMGDNSSVTEYLKSNNSIAKVISLDEFKITKTSFKKAISKEIESGYLEID
ncbi:hypothetical protein [Helcococcus sueciensis]|uniref:hypothetical protein n=1 Tax=Helcococcus sueciensis TaxID=241555 RepID=UPI0003FA3BB1|nr:hypothetical protein [Helcococcus sueciensis]